ncbi:GNAT family N-acetyltransferase [Larkinella soli]|uniref:GNAT family N-acetyltransferase n=1 Tax=Larkinella soli TaxID=1770527 RepID=UPI000FFB7034|nr:GNAT family N-acetyltransferase [Larkinella soli]
MNQPLLELVRRNFIAKSTGCARRLSGMVVEETDDFTLVDTGMPTDTFNVVVTRTGRSESLQAVFEGAVRRFRERAVPAALWCWEPDFSPTLDRYLEKHGFLLEETNVAMWADLTRPLPASSPENGLRIFPVETPDHYETFAGLLAGLFGDHPEAGNVRRYYRTIAPLHHPNQPYRLYLGRVGDEVVSTGTIYRSDEAAGIYDIATRADRRGHGYGSEMFRFLMEEAHRLGAKQAVLQASPDGLGIYLRAGFEPVGQVRVYPITASGAD